MENLKILYLNRSDIEDLVNIKEVIDVVETSFKKYGLDQVQMPPKMYLYFKKYNGDLRIMPSEIVGMDTSGVKIVNVHPNNREINLPTVMATIVLNSKETGQPLSIMEGGLITDLRTGAAGAIAAKYLSRKNSEVAGFVGLGNQARTQLEALVKVRDIKTVKIFDTNGKTQYSFFEWAKEKFRDIYIVWKNSIEDVCDCDILTTITPVRSPIVKMKWIKPGTHINAIGADAKGKQELDPVILTRSKLVIDDFAQASHSGEINVPLSEGKISAMHIHTTLGQIACGREEGRENDEEITVFDSTGLAIQDLAVANMVYKKAILLSGVGIRLSLF